MSYFSQQGFDVRLEWGPNAIAQLGPEADCIIIIDVMSFSTCVSIACDRHAVIYPFQWKDHRALEYAASIGVESANIDRRFTGQGFSLSPVSISSLPAGHRLVLPSPNGSALTFQAKALSAKVFSACLRNMHATAKACEDFQRILLVPTGEKWPDGSLRPAIEDLIAAGGIISHWQHKRLSAEAQLALASYQQSAQRQHQPLRECGSAVELTERGFAEDVNLCCQQDISPLACYLQENCFVGI